MTFKITQNDTSPSLATTLLAEGEPIDLSDATAVRFLMEDRYERLVIDDDLSGSVRFLDASNGEVEYTFSASDTQTVGSYHAEFEVTYNNGSIETFPSNGKIDIEIVEEIA